MLNYQTKDQFRINTDESNASRYDKHILEPSMISTKSNAPLNQSKRNFKMQLDPIAEKCPNQSKDARSFQSNKYKLHIKDKGLYYDIKIDKLHDFVNEPLKMYDEKQSDDDCIYELLSKGIHLQGISKWTNQDQTVIHKPCVVVDYNRKTQQFLIQWMDNEQIKEVSRLNLIFEHESYQYFSDRQGNALERRKNKLYSQTLSKIIKEEQ